MTQGFESALVYVLVTELKVETFDVSALHIACWLDDDVADFV